MRRDDVIAPGPHDLEADWAQPYALVALVARSLIAGSIIASAAWLLISVVLDRVG